uniref:Peptidase_M1 domain-containing protein n=1 Tax=Ascaris lumbricoides TaxID=6252 RepID=A0A0M3I9D9_ASCLU
MHIQYERELADPQYTTAWLYFLVASYCAHETVHQWFGNLVTTEFFNRMFLNEAMAQYWETNGIMYAFPEQARMGKFERFRKGLDGFEVDSSPLTSKPVVPDRPKYSTGIIYDKGATLLHMLSNTVSPEVLQLGLQSYLKRYQYSNTVDADLWREITDGATLLHMLSNTVSPEVLQLGLQSYLKRYQYSNTVDADLWREITDASASKGLTDWNDRPLNVSELMDPWIYQATYPVLKVVYDGAFVTYSQEPFILNATSVLGPAPYNYQWIIPVFSQTASGNNFHYFVGSDGGSSFWKRPLNGWQVENAGFAGFFRVWYDESTWNPILNQLNTDPLVFDELTRAQKCEAGFFRVWYDESTWNPILNQLNTDPLVFDELTRAQFVADAVALREYAFSKFHIQNAPKSLNKRGSLDWKRVLDIAFLLRNEKELAPWYAFIGTLDLLIDTFENTADWGLLQAFVQKIVQERYSAIGWNITGEWSQDMLSSYITEWACAVDLKGCRELAASSMTTFAINCERSMSGTGLCNALPPDVRRSQYCWGTYENADPNGVVGKMYDWFAENSKYFERDTDKLLEGMACTRDTAKFNALIADTLTGKLPSKMLGYLGNHDSTGQLLWSYFERNPAEIIYGVPSTLDYMNAAMKKWKKQADVDQAIAFLNGNGAELLSDDDKKAMRSAIQSVNDRIEWIADNVPSISTWLKNHVGDFYE